MELIQNDHCYAHNRVEATLHIHRTPLASRVIRDGEQQIRCSSKSQFNRHRSSSPWEWSSTECRARCGDGITVLETAKHDDQHRDDHMRPSKTT